MKQSSTAKRTKQQKKPVWLRSNDSVSEVDVIVDATPTEMIGLLILERYGVESLDLPTATRAFLSSRLDDLRDEVNHEIAALRGDDRMLGTFIRWRRALDAFIVKVRIVQELSEREQRSRGNA